MAHLQSRDGGVKEGRGVIPAKRIAKAENVTDGSAIGLDWNAIYRELNTIQLQWNTANTGEVFNEVFSGMNTLQQLPKTI